MLTNVKQYHAMLMYIVFGFERLGDTLIVIEIPHQYHILTTVDQRAAQASSRKQDLTPLVVVSSDKSQCFDSSGTLMVIYGSLLTLHNKQDCLNNCLQPGQGLVNHHQRSSLALGVEQMSVCGDAGGGACTVLHACYYMKVITDHLTT